MEILVCVKQVPDTAEIKITPGSNDIDLSGAPQILNPFDANAVEAAVQLKETNGAKVTVLSMGSEQSKAALKEAISVGADRAILLADPLFQDSDTYATSSILASAIKKLGKFDLIICGKQSVDGDSGQVGPQIAEHLGITQLTLVSKIEVKDNVVVVNRQHDDGHEVVTTQTPAVCCVLNTINIPRYATVKSKLAANRATIEILKAADLPDLDLSMIGPNGSLIKMIELYAPSKKATGVRIKEETAAETGVKLAKTLIADKVI